MVTELTEEEFYEKVFDVNSNTLKANGNVLVDMYASTCGPCKIFGKLFEQFSGQFPDWTFYKLCVDDADDIMIQYKLRSMPTVLRIKNEEQCTFPAVHTAEQLQAILTGEENN